MNQRVDLYDAMHDFAVRVLKGSDNAQETAILPDVLRLLIRAETNFDQQATQ